MEIISRAEARQRGLKVFFTGVPCTNGHLCERYVSVGRCLICNSVNSKRHRESHKDRINAERRERRLQRIDVIREQKRHYYHRNLDKCRAACRAWRTANRDKALAYLREWQKANAEYFSKQKTAYYLERKSRDPQFAMLTRLRRRINHFVAGTNKSATTAELIGCSYSDFAQHIESQFLPGMSWENRDQWHIDHIVPCAAFDLADPAQQRACFHYTNMRPLWAKENQAKGATISMAA